MTNFILVAMIFLAAGIFSWSPASARVRFHESWEDWCLYKGFEWKSDACYCPNSNKDYCSAPTCDDFLARPSSPTDLGGDCIAPNMEITSEEVIQKIKEGAKNLENLEKVRSEKVPSKNNVSAGTESACTFHVEISEKSSGAYTIKYNNTDWPGGSSGTIEDDDGFLTMLTEYQLAKVGIEKTADATPAVTGIPDKMAPNLKITKANLRKAWERFKKISSDIKMVGSAGLTLYEKASEFQEWKDFEEMLKKDDPFTHQDLDKTKNVLRLIGSPNDNKIQEVSLPSGKLLSLARRVYQVETDSEAKEGCRGGGSKKDRVSWCYREWSDGVRCQAFSDRTPLTSGGALCAGDLFALTLPQHPLAKCPGSYSFSRGLPKANQNGPSNQSSNNKATR